VTLFVKYKNFAFVFYASFLFLEAAFKVQLAQEGGLLQGACG